MSHSCSHYSFHNCANCINEDVIHKRRVHTPISQINGRLHNTFYMFFVRRPAGPVCVGFCVFCPKVLVCCIILVEWSEVRPMQCLTVTLCYSVTVSLCDTVTLCYTVTLFCKSMLPRLSAKSRFWQKSPLIAAECQLLLMSTMIMTKLSFESNSVKLHSAIVWKRVQCSGWVVARFWQRCPERGWHRLINDTTPGLQIIITITMVEGINPKW